MTDYQRFLERLVARLEARDPLGVHRPFSIDDLRRTLMPYRQHRAAIGLSSSEDYELLVLRLIAEDGGYGRAYPAEAAERARAEIASPNPDLDLVEVLGETTIQIGASGLARIVAAAAKPDPAEEPEPPHIAPMSGPDGAGDGPAAVAGPELASDSVGPAAAPEPPALPDAAARVVAPSAAEPEPFEPIADSISVDEGLEERPGADPGHSLPPTCPGCHATLPDHRAVTFCPFCGVPLGVRRCARCGAEIEPGWRHCVVCGHQATPAAFA